ncbi:tail protein X [Desulfovibrio sp. JC010]|uniref:tail protein X n=1 Tax=Desulfovibrio sp. JC010 TaxID=2593641 RepID=UPI0013CFB4D9|nr:tail protein X [Desulfovibrio sp. JC010]NDV27706.1 phage tail protein [Desulfovibrio sp. JC010]
MSTTYMTIDGDMLDELCYRQYGREGAVTAVLEANPGLAAKGTKFEAGVVIIFPDLDETAEQAATIKLWD